MLKKYFNYYRALFPGELSIKVKRKIALRFGVMRKRCIRSIETLGKTEIRINKYFINLFSVDEYRNINVGEKLDKINLLGHNVDLETDFLDDNKNSTYWYRQNIHKYKDIKILWEINRLQFLPLFVNSGQVKKAILIFKDWVNKNPYNRGINWNNNLEVAIRGISILNFFIKMKDKDLLEEYKYILYAHGLHVYEDIEYTEKCIPNNHVIGEAGCLYCLGHFFTNENWINKSKVILEKYMSHFRDDGTYVEGSLSYHRFVLQMYLMVLVFSIIFKDQVLITKIVQILEKSLNFFKAIEKPNGMYPDFGDNDEGRYFVLLKDSKDFNKFVKSLNNCFDKNENFYGELQELEKIYDIRLEFSSCIKHSNFFESGRYYAYKNGNNYIFIHNQDQLFHSHADGLSIELMLNNKNVLVDSGTYNYNTDSIKRHYYRGTQSHNTVDTGKDQSIQVGTFRWISQSILNLKLLCNDKIKQIYGEISNGNTVFNRNIRLDENFEKIEITDSIMNTEKCFINWIFSSEIKLEKKDDTNYILLPINHMITITGNCSIEVEKKRLKYSPAYNKEENCWNLYVKCKKSKDQKKIVVKTMVKKGTDR